MSRTAAGLPGSGLQHDKDSGVFVCATLTDILVCFHCLRKQQQQGGRPATGSFYAHQEVGLTDGLVNPGMVSEGQLRQVIYK